jgi:hypothetical protein
MIRTLRSQLHFVRDVQRVETGGVEPLRAIRDETPEGIVESTIGMEELKDALAAEVRFGHYRRPRRVRGARPDVPGAEAEDWDPLGCASRTAGRYFVMKSGKQTVD